jgi:phosphoenolpyruvate carboxykinase (GTP)
MAPEWTDPAGVPIDAILLGGRRADTVPLVTEAKNWRQGTFLGSAMGSEKTAAAAGAVGKLRRDPMAMLPFCGYHMADYFRHWLEVGRAGGADESAWGTMPRLFYVNWFRKDADGRFIWPGFGDNSRVLKWIFERCAGRSEARETPIGYVPTPEALDTSGLKLTDAEMEALLSVDPEEWEEELQDIDLHYTQFGDRLPEALRDELAELKRLFSKVKR